MKQSQKNYKRIVVKIGSSLLSPDKDRLDFKISQDVAAQVASLIQAGKEVLVVSSGAIALGMSMLGLKEKPKEMAMLQAAAAIGQNALMDNYSNSFRNYKITCAQILLTWDDFDNRQRYLNANNTLMTLLRLGVVPVINENDSISTEEIKFGDNDQLSARVAGLISADILIILSDVDGLLDKDKTLVRVVDKITPQIKALACLTDKETCVGGMVTKIEAAKIAIRSGIPCVIANGLTSGVILDAVKEPSSVGTLFVPRGGYLDAKKRWLAFGTKPKGKIIVDEGARLALCSNKSLLSVGITFVEGNFKAGDIVSIIDNNSHEFARGSVSVSSVHIDEIKGKRSEKEVIHRDNIVIL